MSQRLRVGVHPVRMLSPGRCPIGALLMALALSTAACGPAAAGPADDGSGGGDSAGGGGGGNTASEVAFEASVGAVTAMGFTLLLQPGVPGIMPEDLALAPSVAIAKATAHSEMSTSYAVETAARLTPGQEYTLTISKAGYRMTTNPTVTWVAEATITKMTLTLHGVTVEGTITGEAIRFPNAPRAATPTLTGTVSLTLSEGAQLVGGDNPHGMEKTYSSAAIDMTVQAADGTTTKTYSVAVASYDAETNPYGVYTAEELHAVRKALTDSYLLMKDLTLPDAGTDCGITLEGQNDYCTGGWQPIGTSSTSFTGTFDGNGHRIQNLFIDRSVADKIGLFAALDAPGVLRNLGVTSGDVKGNSYVGGLVGEMKAGTVTNAYATGVVTGSGNYVGGLVGRMHDGTITNAYATGAVSGSSHVGGLVGTMEDGTVTNAYATGAVSGSGRVGGLVGYNATGTVTNSYATGAVTGSGYSVGGLVGYNAAGTITNAYATGAVTGSGNYVGGLVGISGGTITNAYATGAVFGSGSDIGGLVGRMSGGTVTNAYATGAVFGRSSNADIGGLVGDMNGGTVTNAYATGAIFGSSNADIGGLVGRRRSAGTITDSYYPLGRPPGEGSDGTPLASGSMQSAFSGFAFAGDDAAWEWVEGRWPQLQGFEAMQTTPSLTFHSARVLLPPPPTNRRFTLTLSPYVAGLQANAWTLYDSSSGAPTTPIRMTPVINSFNYAVEANLVMGKSYRLMYTKPDLIVLSETFAHMTVKVPNSADVLQMTLTYQGIEVPAEITIRTSATSSIVFPYAPRTNPLKGLVSLVLADGAQVVGGGDPDGTEKTYTTTAENVTVRAADGTEKTYAISKAAYNASRNPYGVYTLEELYAVRNGLTSSYILIKDLALPDGGVSGCTKPSSFQSDYCKKGWKPIGTLTSRFTGTFDGNGHRITNLFIGRSETSYVGLFAIMGTSGNIRNLGVASAGVTGDYYVGGLVGYVRGGTVSNAYATGPVSGGNNYVGGLVGYMMESSAVSNSYATGPVSGNNYVGGLVGYIPSSRSTITHSYVTGAVSGNNYVGGLVGYMSSNAVSNSYATGAVSGSTRYVGGLLGGLGSSSGTVSNSYATGAVSGRGHVGGLVGDNAGAVTNSYATGAVTGDNDVGGLLGKLHTSRGTVTGSYYPKGRPLGTGSAGTPLESESTKPAFSAFSFGATGWKWVDGQWPLLNGIAVAQKTPSLAFHTAAVESPSTTGFAVTLTPALDDRPKEAWALYDSSSSTVILKKSTAASGGARYTFEATLTRGASYHLIYSKADVVVVPSSAGHITVTVPNN